MAHVHKVVDPLAFAFATLARPERFALSQLVIMMRESQVYPPGVDIDLTSENLRRHGRALDMPSGSARAPWTGPAWLAWFGGLPERKICFRFLLRRLFGQYSLAVRKEMPVVSVPWFQPCIWVVRSLESVNIKID